MATSSTDQFFKNPVLGHPAGLFVLFFTEMWERFSYYGMRALLVLFLTSSLFDEGWAWPREHALALYGTYTSLVYLTPILGGYIADKIIGYRKAVVIGALLMTLGHAAMAVDTSFALYLGLFFLVVGNGFFKPTMTSIISQMYENHPHKKDGAYTIYYMGVNAGAFLGILLCGYTGEQWGWHWGFGLAGVFMFAGMLQFYFAQNIFGDVGKKPLKNAESDLSDDPTIKLNPFLTIDKVFIAISALIGLVWIINDPMSKIGGSDLFDFEVGPLSGSNFMILFALIVFIVLLVSRIIRYAPVVRDRMIAVSIFAFFTVFFWAAFEQAGGSMTIFANDYTDRVLEGSAGTIFRIANTLITIIPLCVITWVLWMLFKQTFGKYKLANLILGGSFVIIWALVITMLYEQYTAEAPEVPASWFSVLNSLFIIIFAPLFSKLWESKYNPSVAVKYGIGLILLGAGFAALAYGASDIPQGAKVAAVSIIWLVLAYFFHTMGELCLSPVGLSYVSKLVPGRMIAMMYGVWYLAIAIGNKLAGSSGGMIDQITAEYSLSTFFLLFFFIPGGAGILIILLHPLLKKLMHGIH
ncbi:peptide MFS transporter [Leeuwenhoekiella aequorea]|uniref:POT family proton-dependent oligopeptide transporter n=1 Tax=Leeuwenhoekiella aequorea TaxID=283736 RepID=A0A4Q0P8K1_9FLAO|nr:peptide MFS transporter [Leeuwenhoekiella aequorea]RXG22845.1 POT family proton-dependent oligopeptide transporter [Leeuwenhoekiella aequorea]